jgi:uncharacterized protein YhbP (UPF0306 family)
MSVEQLTAEAVLEAVRRHLAARHVCTLATSQGDIPWAASSFYVARGLDLFVCQGKRARTLANMRVNPVVGFAVDDRKAEAWLQGLGRASPASPEDETWAREQLRQRAPEFTHHFANPEQPVLLLHVEEVTFADRPNGIYPRKHLRWKDERWDFTHAG